MFDEDRKFVLDIFFYKIFSLFNLPILSILLIFIVFFINILIKNKYNMRSVVHTHILLIVSRLTTQNKTLKGSCDKNKSISIFMNFISLKQLYQ